MSVHFISKHAEWRTPANVYAELDAEFHFDFDPCPLSDLNTTLVSDGLTADWGRSTFCNPPYGRAIGLWTRKAREEARKGKTIVLLIPSRTDTIWWHRDVMPADEIRFIQGRLKFSGAKFNAPFPSAVVVFRGSLDGGEGEG